MSGVDTLRGIRPLTHREDIEALSRAPRQLVCYKEAAVPASLSLLLRTRRGPRHPLLLLGHPPTHPGLDPEGHGAWIALASTVLALTASALAPQGPRVLSGTLCSRPTPRAYLGRPS